MEVSVLTFSIQLAVLCVVLLFVPLTVWFSSYTSRNYDMCQGFENLAVFMARREPNNVHVIGFIRLVKGASAGATRSRMIAVLLHLAIYENNRVMFLALRDEIGPGHLQRALLTEPADGTSASLFPYLSNLRCWMKDGNETGKKFALFAMGIRPLALLDAEISGPEQKQLVQRFGSLATISA